MGVFVCCGNLIAVAVILVGDGMAHHLPRRWNCYASKYFGNKPVVAIKAVFGAVVICIRGGHDIAHRIACVSRRVAKRVNLGNTLVFLIKRKPQHPASIGSKLCPDDDLNLIQIGVVPVLGHVANCVGASLEQPVLVVNVLREVSVEVGDTDLASDAIEFIAAAVACISVPSGVLYAGGADFDESVVFPINISADAA